MAEQKQIHGPEGEVAKQKQLKSPFKNKSLESDTEKALEQINKATEKKQADDNCICCCDWS